MWRARGRQVSKVAGSSQVAVKNNHIEGEKGEVCPSLRGEKANNIGRKLERSTVRRTTIPCPRLGVEWIGWISWLPRAPLGPIFMTNLYQSGSRRDALAGV